MDVNGHAYETAGTRAVAAVTLVLLPAAVLLLGSVGTSSCSATKPSSTPPKKRSAGASRTLNGAPRRSGRVGKTGRGDGRAVWRPLLRRDDLAVTEPASRGRGRKGGHHLRARVRLCGHLGVEQVIGRRACESAAALESAAEQGRRRGPRVSIQPRRRSRYESRIRGGDVLPRRRRTKRPTPGGGSRTRRRAVVLGCLGFRSRVERGLWRPTRHDRPWRHAAGQRRSPTLSARVVEDSSRAVRFEVSSRPAERRALRRHVGSC